MSCLRGDSNVLLSWCAPFPRVGSVRVDPSSVPVHKRRTSAKQCCMFNRRSVFHWSNMSRNQSRTMGSTSTLRRFAVLPLDSSSSIAAAGAAQGVPTRTSSWFMSGRAMASPSRHQPGRCLRTPCGSSWWWWMCSCRARSQSCYAGPSDFACLSGGNSDQQTGRAIAPRSARTSASKEDARSTGEEDRMLTKRCIERQWKNIELEKQLFESEKTSV